MSKTKNKKSVFWVKTLYEFKEGVVMRNECEFYEIIMLCCSDIFG
jgi:hypothetical protein